MFKKIIFHTLGLKAYLKVLHKSFHWMYAAGGLKNNVIYKYHYFDRYMIQNGDVVLDIGGNLGYYTKLFAKWVGPTGHVYAVEPVVDFANVIKWGTNGLNNVTIYNVALGEEEKDITLSTPGKFGYLRTGLAHVTRPDEQQEVHEFTFRAKMKRGSKLFADLRRIDFIKCDIEGYEEYVLSEMKDVLLKHKPVLQLETYGEQKAKLETLLMGMGYEIYDIEDNKLKPLAEMKNPILGDFFYIHKDNKGVIERLKKTGHA